MNKILISHITGNENTRNSVYGLLKKNMLFSFLVSIAVYRDAWYYRLLSFKPLRFLKKR